LLAINIMEADIVVIREGCTLSRAMDLFGESASEALPVLDGEGRLMGVVSREDLESAISAGSGEEAAGRRAVSLVGLARGGFVSAGPGATADELREMLGAGASAVYIVDGGGRLLGRVQGQDLLRREREYQGGGA